MRHTVLLAACLLCAAAQAMSAEWKPAAGPLATRWTKHVTPDNAWREYPRPQMVRTAWMNLNGLWDYAIHPKEAPQPETWDGQILVPFCVESALSGVMKKVTPQQAVWYRRTFWTPEFTLGKRVLLHFGAVDWDATVWLNGHKVGQHRGGYDPFTFDITDALKRFSFGFTYTRRGPNTLVVRAWDPTDTGYQPRGKQVPKPGGIWYTPTTGIWQTVWLEPVPESYVRGLRIVPDVDASLVRVTVDAAGGNVELKARAAHSTVATAAGAPGQPIALKLDAPKLWSPDAPFLYDLKITLSAGGTSDEVSSYFGMRKIAVGKDKDGVERLLLNGKPLFQFGPLDQGFWPDGLYTAPCDEALRYDVETIKRLGMNMARKHVKVEPARWYYWCDKLGLMIWQDMPSGNNNGAEGRKNFARELEHVVKALINHPSIVMWVPFNEGWGQHDTEDVVEMVRRWDPWRLVDNASGWTDRKVGDVHDIHSYPGPAMPLVEEKRAAVLGEFGGLGLPLAGHTWQAEKNWGYRSFKTREDLTDAYVNLLENLRPLIGRGLCAAVYTQISDVEVECNGLMTYDRALVKMDPQRMGEAARKLYLPPPLLKVVVPTSQRAAQTWRYTTQRPSDNWAQPGFDDSSWKTGPGGFGEPSTPGAVVRTRWKTPDIWIRRTVELGRIPRGLRLMIHHDEDAEVYLNGVLAASLKGYTTSYAPMPIAKEAIAALKKGRNTLAIHCHQTQGGQYIDAGLAELVPRGE
jgi:hypothetical protein